jgi:hypothetical protein
VCARVPDLVAACLYAADDLAAVAARISEGDSGSQVHDVFAELLGEDPPGCLSEADLARIRQYYYHG